MPEADGRLVVGGRFDRFGDWPRNSLVRLQANGDLDPTFDVGSGPIPRQVVEQGVTQPVPPEVRVVVPHPQGGWLVGGDFAGFDSLTQPFLVRLGPGAPPIARTVQWETLQADLEEGAGSTDLLLRRTGSAEASMTVLVAVPEPQWDPVTGQFTGYVPQNRLVTFAPGEWWQRIWVDGFDDSRAAPDVVVSARMLEAWDGFALAGNPAVELTLRNDDFTVEFLERTLERDEGDREVRVGLVWRGSEPATVPAGRLREWRAEVVYQPPGRPAVVVPATLPFAGDPAPAEAGSWVPRAARTNWVNLPIPDDAVRRMDETWTVRLRPPASAWPAYPAQSSGGTDLTVRIRDNDFTLGARRGANGPVHALTLDPDGRLYVGGAFTSLHGRPRAGLARLLPDGRIDESFSPTHFPDGPVVALAILPDGGILAAGDFQRAGGPDGHPRAGLAAFDQAGGLRPEFGAGLGPRRWQASESRFAPAVDEPGSIAALTALPDGGILAAGNFRTFDDLSRPGLVRLQPDGTVDRAWVPALSALLLPSDPFLPPRRPLGRSLDPAWTGVRTDELGRVWVWNRETLRSTRLLADGRADTGLAHPGQVTTILPQTGGAFWVGRRTQAPIQPARTARSDWLSVSRYQPDGQLDPAFQVRDVPPRMVDVAEVLHLAQDTDGRLWVVVDLGPWAVNAP
ncbi:MAG: delta-60 repeat domain-containing protein, partial [Verrucomicrobiota bacterium]